MDAEASHGKAEALANADRERPNRAAAVLTAALPPRKGKVRPLLPRPVV